MAVYNLCYNNKIEELYSLKDVRDRFRKDAHFYEFLELEGYMFCLKQNEKSRTEYLIKPIGIGEVELVYVGNEKIIDGAYGN
tara:strand:- start:1232 stop:1477 length:246 start_codon:yes stop_codon:yes gene_type:complete